MSEMLNILGRR